MCLFVLPRPVLPRPHRWTINLALQTASQVFRVDSQVDSGDLYEVMVMAAKSYPWELPTLQ